MSFPTAHGEPLAHGKLKTFPEDFLVQETLSFPLSGHGEHLYLYIKKTNANTEWVSKQLARNLGVSQRDIGYAGLKDRHGITCQWFSLPGKTITNEKLAAVRIDGVEITEQIRHDRKLRKGAIKENHFTIRVRELVVDQDALSQRLQLIVREGVPNYFDEQRFGRQRANLVAVQQLFERKIKVSHFQRGIYLSAARAWIFNHILARRVQLQNWNTAIPGDVYWLEGTKRFFKPDANDAQIDARLARGDIHPTGALWGDGELQSSDEVEQLERDVAIQNQQFVTGLVAARLAQDRRSLRVLPRDLTYQYDPEQQMLTLSFALPAGAYATAVVREVVQVNETQDVSLN